MRRPLGIILPILLLIVWEIAAQSINNQFILPRLETVIPVLLSPTTDILGTGSLVHNAMVSLERVGAGFLVVLVTLPLRRLTAGGAGTVPGTPGGARAAVVTTPKRGT